MNDLNKDIQYVKGVGPAKAQILKKIGINTLGDAIYYFPRGHEDRGKVTNIAELVDGEEALISAFVMGKVTEFRANPRLTICKLMVRDETGSCQITWYNQKYLKNSIKPNERYKFYGKVSKKTGRADMQSPVFEPAESIKNTGRIVPVYPLTYNLTQNSIRNVIENAINSLEGKLDETLPQYLIDKFKFLDNNTAIRQIHFPDSFDMFNKARDRLVFEELLAMQLALLSLKNKYEIDKPGIAFDKKVKMSDIINRLPFKLTNAQGRVLKEIDRDMEKPKPMNRLLQGDVGSRKNSCSFDFCI